MNMILHFVGHVLMYDEQLDGEILIFIRADDVPELDELFVINLIAVNGGAEIDQDRNKEQFLIK